MGCIRCSGPAPSYWGAAQFLFMLNIHIITLGKLKESYWREAEAEYLKRLQPYAKIFIHELKEESFGEKDNPEIIKKKEADKIKIELLKIKDSYVVALDEHGKQFNSVQFAQNLSNLSNSNNSFTFIIGGPLGLDQTIAEIANLKLSLSPFTFTHQMARIFLIEQIYRAVMIQTGRKYHY